MTIDDTTKTQELAAPSQEWTAKIQSGFQPRWQDIIEAYVHMAAQFDISEQEQNDFLILMWNIAQDCIAAEFGLGSTQLALKARADQSGANKTGTPCEAVLNYRPSVEKLMNIQDADEDQEKTI